jgi:gluconokinase
MDSQFAALEEPGPEERAVTLSVGPAPALVLRAALEALAAAAVDAPREGR